ncbi:hypothetical protein CVS40_5792 [Lucilia cuprina]|nr:hypothetical protein CVS40_5792 [Lucilia cuprina]
MEFYNIKFRRWCQIKLNSGFGNGGYNTTANSNCINYTIVKGTPDPQQDIRYPGLTIAIQRYKDQTKITCYLERRPFGYDTACKNKLLLKLEKKLAKNN